MSYISEPLFGICVCERFEDPQKGYLFRLIWRKLIAYDHDGKILDDINIGNFTTIEDTNIGQVELRDPYSDVFESRENYIPLNEKMFIRNLSDECDICNQNYFIGSFELQHSLAYSIIGIKSSSKYQRSRDISLDTIIELSTVQQELLAQNRLLYPQNGLKLVSV